MTTQRYTDDEVYLAVRACCDDLKKACSMSEYLGWARRPDVRSRPGRRPRSYHPFQPRGGMRAVLIAAGVIDENTARIGVDGRLLPLRHAYTREDLLDALRLVSERVKVPLMTVARYTRERESIQDAAREAGKLVALPAGDTIREAFGSWNAALRAAGLPTIDTRAASLDARSQKRYTREEKLGWLRQAWVELGEPFTSTAYKTWRATRTARGDEPGPSVEAIAREFGTWTAAGRLARPSERPAPPGRTDP